MKRLLLTLAVMLFAGAAFAAAPDRDVLITKAGTVFSIVSEASQDGLNTSLALTIESGDKITHSVLPESVDNGVNSRPTLAYDVESDTLFVVWMRMPNDATSELLVAAYHDDQWQPALIIDGKRPAQLYNLNVGITHHVQQVQRDDAIIDVPALILHAVWWEAGAGRDGARYAVMGVKNGAISEADVHDMSEFLGSRDTSVEEPKTGHNGDFLRHVALLSGPTPDAVDVLFGDQKTNSFYRTTLRPIAHVRIRIPVGARPGTPIAGPKKALGVDWTGRTSTLVSPDGNTIIFVNATDKKLSYVKYAGGDWSSVQQVTLSQRVTAEAAIGALAKMLAAAE
jgi:hypothetical protein